MKIEDVLGIKPFGDSFKIVTEKSLSAAGAILGPICLPAANEIGLMLRDEVRCWRAKNVERIAEKALKYSTVGKDGVELHAHPKIMKEIVENGSYTDDETVQEMWAGLIASACTPDGKDQSNLMFIDVLSKLTPSQARLLNYICQNAKKIVSPMRLPSFVSDGHNNPSSEELHQVMGITDDYQIFLEIRHLETIGLIILGAHKQGGNYSLAARDFAVHLYIRCHGSKLPPEEFFPKRAEV